MMFDEESPTPSPAKLGSLSADSQSRDIDLPALTRKPASHATGDVEDSDEDSDLDVRRPLGRAARRMLGGNGASLFESNSETKSSSPRVSTGNVSDDEDLYSATPMKARIDHMTSPSLPASAARSTLFVSPTKSVEADDSEDELPSKPFDSKARLAELVAQKRAERLAKEAEDEERRKDRVSSAHASSDLPDEIVEGSQEPANPEIERIMSDAAKPTRKASKRAMIEMERETQRIARQQALAHQMKTKKKFTTSDLFAKFNFRPAGDSSISAVAEGDTAVSSVPHSDATEASIREPVSTPPSSPPTPLDRQRELVEKGALSKMMPVRQDTNGSLTSLVDGNSDDDGSLPDVSEILKPSASAQFMVTEPSTKRGLKLAKLGKKPIISKRDDSSDDELEIIPNAGSRWAIFDKAKGLMKQQNTDSKAIHTLKHLSHIGMDAPQSGRRRKGASRPSINPQVLEAQLRMRAKQQARDEQQERIAELRAKGIEIQTSEEREREQEEFENLLEKARQDALDLRKAEKAAAKGEDGHVAASDDESEDEDYTDGSASEGDGVHEKESNDLVDDLADESEDDDDENETEGEDIELERLAEDDLAEEAPGETMQDLDAESVLMETPVQTQAPFKTRRPRNSRVIMDEDDEELDLSQPLPGIAEDDDDDEEEDPFAAFGFGPVKAASSLMSPTQAFNATMQTPTQASQQDSMDVLRYMAPPTSSSLPPIAVETQSQSQGDSQLSCIPGSQIPQSQPIDLAWETQAPETPVPGMKRGNSTTASETPGWQPTQDDGLPATWSATPLLQREDTLEAAAEDDTQSTVVLRVSESPAATAPVRKRLVRGQRALSESSDDEPTVPATPAERAKKDAFREMARKRREALTAAERAEAEREAKGMMDEQAEESEDEYTGLGGDDFVAPETEQDREMIDSSHIDVDERQLAAHFAERQRLADEAATSKLFKDITSGALRKKQGNMFDLDEDEDDLAVRRRQMRQREEARKRKLLLQDDNIAGLAEGKHSKGKDAFLKAIADDEDDGDGDDDVLDLSDEEGERFQESQTDSQPSQQVASRMEPLQEISGNKRRREDTYEDRPPAKQRRTKASAFRAPKSLLEVKESVSFLLEESHSAMVGPSALDDSSDDEAEQQEEEDYDDDTTMQEELERQNDGGFAPDRIAMPPPRLPASQRRTAPRAEVVDRLSLKRTASAGEGVHSRSAWGATNKGGFKTPSLLRRATTNTASGANERGVTTSANLSRENSGSGVKMGGTKKSSLAYQARAEEQKAIVEASAKRRAENTARIAQLRRAASSGFGRDLSDRFE